MIKYEYGKRIKMMINREITLERRENTLSKLSSKYHERLENLEIRHSKQSEKFDKFHKRIREEKQNYERLEKLISDMKSRMQEAENEAQRCVADTLQQRQQLIHQLDQIHSLKLSTNTYINLSALPARIQGVFLQEKEDGYSWHPFCVEPLSHTPEELRNIIWGNCENAASYSEAWEHLVFRSVRALLQELVRSS
ncbi:unnamed protein product [Ceratitis capitata]|uniref:(Mediterranean fruit fly) hypothetical protein n=1 Tax=Ceratitis capitata TaxID=7213 RepID=W8C5L7_CERCA|nr:unnamed protein product [Ceratitis capitata]